MTAPRPSFDPPTSTPIAEANGLCGGAYQIFFDRAAKALEILRQAATDMEDLDETASTAELGAAWAALREKLQEIV